MNPVQYIIDGDDIYFMAVIGYTSPFTFWKFTPSTCSVSQPTCILSSHRGQYHYSVASHCWHYIFVNSACITQSALCGALCAKDITFWQRISYWVVKLYDYTTHYLCFA